MNSEPKEQDNGRLWTPGAVDFFRIVNEQVDAVAGVTRGDFLLHTAQAVLEAMLDFQVRVPCCSGSCSSIAYVQSKL